MLVMPLCMLTCIYDAEILAREIGELPSLNQVGVRQGLREPW